MMITYGQAINKALQMELENNNDLVMFGQDIRHNVYGYTNGLVESFGGSRVIDTPLSEAAVVGTAIGAALCGVRTIVDLTVANFIYVAMDQIASIAAKNSYMYNGQLKLPLTIMYSTFQNTGSAAQHSDRPHPLVMNIPGLKVVAPSTPVDAYGLLRSSINDDSPVIYFSDRSLFYCKEELILGEVVELGKANLVSSGDDITIITISGCAQLVAEIQPMLTKNNISAEIIDVRSLVPLDINTILTSVRKTGRVVIADTANKTCSAASEIASIIAEKAFYDLKSPIGTVTYDDVPVPFAANLEKQIMPTSEKLLNKVLQSFNKRN